MAYDDSLSWEENLARTTLAEAGGSTSPTVPQKTSPQHPHEVYVERDHPPEYEPENFDPPYNHEEDEDEEVVPREKLKQWFEPHAAAVKEGPNDDGVWDYGADEGPVDEDSGERFELPAGHPVEPYYDRQRERTWNTHPQPLPEKHEIWMSPSYRGEKAWHTGSDFNEAADKYAEAIALHTQQNKPGSVVWTRDDAPFQIHDTSDEDDDDGPDDSSPPPVPPAPNTSPSGLTAPPAKQRATEREPAFHSKEGVYDEGKTWEENLARVRLVEGPHDDHSPEDDRFGPDGEGPLFGADGWPKGHESWSAPAEGFKPHQDYEPGMKRDDPAEALDELKHSSTPRYALFHNPSGDEDDWDTLDDENGDPFHHDPAVLKDRADKHAGEPLDWIASLPDGIHTGKSKDGSVKYFVQRDPDQGGDGDDPPPLAPPPDTTPSGLKAPTQQKSRDREVVHSMHEGSFGSDDHWKQIPTGEEEDDEPENLEQAMQAVRYEDQQRDFGDFRSGYDHGHAGEMRQGEGLYYGAGYREGAQHRAENKPHHFQRK